MLAAFVRTFPFLPLSRPCSLPFRPLLGALLVPSAGLRSLLTCTFPCPALRLLLFIPPPPGPLWLRARASRRNRRAA